MTDPNERNRLERLARTTLYGPTKEEAFNRFSPLEPDDLEGFMFTYAFENADRFETAGESYIRDRLNGILEAELIAWCWDERAKRVPPGRIVKDYEIADALGWAGASGEPIHAWWTLDRLQRPDQDKRDLMTAECGCFRGCGCYDDVTETVCDNCESCDCGLAALEADLAARFSHAELAWARGEGTYSPTYAVKLKTSVHGKLSVLNGMPKQAANSRQRPEAPGDEYPEAAIATIRKWSPGDQELFRLAWIVYAEWSEIAERFDGNQGTWRSKAVRLRAKAFNARSVATREVSYDRLAENEATGGAHLDKLLDRTDVLYDHA